MDVSYTPPLARAWARARTMLLRPFRIETWLVTGFAAFLAFLAYGGPPLWGLRGNWVYHRQISQAPEDLANASEHVARWLGNPVVLLMIAAALVAFAVIALGVAYVSARAHFVFLENVLTGRPGFVSAWHRYGRLGRSLFLWQAAFSFAWLVPLAVVATPVVRVLRPAFTGATVRPDWISLVPSLVGAGLLAIVLLFVLQMTCEFVVPLMRRYDESASAAWRRFWPLFTTHLGDFVAYVLFEWVLSLVALVGVLAAGFATCCVGLVLVSIPYVGTVVLLPLFVTFRAFGPEFLAQYGPDWDTLAGAAPAAAPAPPAG